MCQRFNGMDKKCRNWNSSCEYLLYEKDSYLEISTENIWTELSPLAGKNQRQKEITTVHTEMVGFFGTSAASDHCHLLPKNGSVHHELIRPHHNRSRSVIRCCSAARGRTRDYYYQVLGITVHSTPQEIKEAYRKLQKKHHPDIAGYKVHPFPSSSSYHLLSYSCVHPFFLHS